MSAFVLDSAERHSLAPKRLTLELLWKPPASFHITMGQISTTKKGLAAANSSSCMCNLFAQAPEQIDMIQPKMTPESNSSTHTQIMGQPYLWHNGRCSRSYNTMEATFHPWRNCHWELHWNLPVELGETINRAFDSDGDAAFIRKRERNFMLWELKSSGVCLLFLPPSLTADFPKISLLLSLLSLCPLAVWKVKEC